MAVQVTPAFAPSFVTVAENGFCAPSCSVAEVGERLMVTAGTVTLASFDFVESLTDAAVRVTVTWAVWEAGGVNVVGCPLGVDVGDTLPHGGAEHDTVQLTPLLAESLVTVAVNCAVAPTSTVAEVLESETLIGGGGGADAPPPQPKLMAAKTPVSSVAIADARFSRRITTRTTAVAATNFRIAAFILTSISLVPIKVLHTLR